MFARIALTLTGLAIALTGAAPAAAQTKLGTLEAQLAAARVQQAAHQQNVVLLAREVATIEARIVVLTEMLEKASDPAVKAELAWQSSNLERHMLRLAHEQREVARWTEMVRLLEAAIKAARDAGMPGTKPMSKLSGLQP